MSIFFSTGFITTDEQALDIPRVAREFGVTSFKYYLHMMQGPATHTMWSGRQKGGWLGFDDGTIYLGMEKAAEIGPPGLICIHPENYEIVRIFEERLKKAGRKDMAAWDERSPHFCEAGTLGITPTTQALPVARSTSCTPLPGNRFKKFSRPGRKGSRYTPKPAITI